MTCASCARHTCAQQFFCDALSNPDYSPTGKLPYTTTHGAYSNTNTKIENNCRQIRDINALVADRRTGRRERKRHPPGQWAEPSRRKIENGSLSVPPPDDELRPSRDDPEEGMELYGESATDRSELLVCGRGRGRLSV
jgi:hypothetical protein